MSNTSANTSSCRYCGKELDSGKDFCKYCGTTTYNEVCPFCKARVPPGALVCSSCGAEKQRYSSSTKRLEGCLSIFVIIGLVMLIFKQFRELGVILTVLSGGLCWIVTKVGEDKLDRFDGKWIRKSAR